MIGSQLRQRLETKTETGAKLKKIMKKNALQRAKQKVSQQTTPAVQVQTNPEAKPSTELQKVRPSDIPTSNRAEAIAQDRQALCEVTREQTEDEEVLVIQQVTGTRSENAGERLLRQAANALVWPNLKQEGAIIQAVAMMAEMAPQNATEAMLAVQMVAVHDAALKFLSGATLDGQTFDGAQANVLRATRLMRLFNEQLDAMAKLKGKTGRQKVTVEHVHVHSGGQAVVGVLDAPRGKKRG